MSVIIYCTLSICGGRCWRFVECEWNHRSDPTFKNLRMKRIRLVRFGQASRLITAVAISLIMLAAPWMQAAEDTRSCQLAQQKATCCGCCCAAGADEEHQCGCEVSQSVPAPDSQVAVLPNDERPGPHTGIVTESEHPRAIPSELRAVRPSPPDTGPSRHPPLYIINASFLI